MLFRLFLAISHLSVYINHSSFHKKNVSFCPIFATGSAVYLFEQIMKHTDVIY